MNLVPFEAIFPNLGLIASPDSFFGSVKQEFQEYKSSGFFKQDSDKAIFVYQLQTRGRSHYGIVTCTDVEDLRKGIVLKHENTIAAKEQKMMNLILHNKAMVKPILLAYDKVDGIDKFIVKEISEEDPFLNIAFEEIDEVHKVWKISSQKKVEELEELFKNEVPVSYIADGHHRVKSCQLLNETSNENEVVDTQLKSILSVYFSWEQLKIYEYNRVIDAFQNHSPIEFMASISKYCKIKRLKTAKKPSKKHEMTMNLYGEWYKLKWRKSILENHKNETVLFDTFLLNKYILGDILGIVNVRDDHRMNYIDGVVGTYGLEEMVAQNENRVGFCMYPIKAENVKLIADQNKTLPPKSTWFEPRVKNGILVKGFE